MAKRTETTLEPMVTVRMLKPNMTLVQSEKNEDGGHLLEFMPGKTPTVKLSLAREWVAVGIAEYIGEPPAED